MGRSCRCLFAVVSLILALFSQGQILRGQIAFVGGSPAPGEIPPAGSLATHPAPFMLPRFPVLPIVPGKPAPPGVVGLPQMVHAAGIIFSGQVLSIAREPALGDASIESIAITFHVERALWGTTSGKNLTIHEWAGLWSSGQRYRAGERVLLFLYPASKLGLTSCVAGPVGRLAVDPWGRVLLSDQHHAAFGGDPALAGKSRVNLEDFVQAVHRAGGEE